MSGIQCMQTEEGEWISEATRGNCPSRMKVQRSITTARWIRTDQTHRELVGSDNSLIFYMTGIIRNMTEGQDYSSLAESLFVLPVCKNEVYLYALREMIPI